MHEKNLSALKFAPEEITQKVKTIFNGILNASKSVTSPNFTSISDFDVGKLFKLYDEQFFNNFFWDNYRQKLNFKISTRMTKSAGKLTYYKQNQSFLISLSTNLLFQTFKNENRTIKVNGFICTNRLEAAMHVLEHEIIHLSEWIVYKNSNCSHARFRSLAKNIFGHTDVTHQLVVGSEYAQISYDLNIGDTVSFQFDGIEMKGIIARITKRATVMVEDGRGQYMDKAGKRYVKYYIPLQILKKR